MCSVIFSHLLPALSLLFLSVCWNTHCNMSLLCVNLRVLSLLGGGGGHCLHVCVCVCQAFCTPDSCINNTMAPFLYNISCYCEYTRIKPPEAAPTFHLHPLILHFPALVELHHAGGFHKTRRRRPWFCVGWGNQRQHAQSEGNLLGRSSWAGWSAESGRYFIRGDNPSHILSVFYPS